ncbi:MAG: Gldg family protein [Sphingobacterium sp.]|jgi:ABC-2 type transport system permease protein|nr:Gldg family protein [Sphingobacterium sp.]
MKKILQIAKTELSLLFYSPIAWLILLIFFIQMALAFVSSVGSVAHLQQFQFEFSSLTDKLYTTPIAMGTAHGIYYLILASLYLYIPLVTMGIVSRESSSGSIKLVYSSPVKLSQLIYGKFMAMVVFSLIIIALMSLFYLFGIGYVENFDFPHPLVALLASFLLLISYSAIGIFMSSLTSYQMVAAVSTFMALAFLNYIGGFGQELDFVRDLTYSLSMPSRANRMVGGLLTSRDVIYYLVITDIFLALTITRLQLIRSPKSFWVQCGRYLLVIFSGLLIAYSSSRQPLIAYYDATATKVNTLVPATQDILKQLQDGPLEMTEYINVLHPSYSMGAPRHRLGAFERWEPYLRFKSDIKLNWVYYYDLLPSPGVDISQLNITNLFHERLKELELDSARFLTPQAIRAKVDLSGEDNRLVVQLKYKNRSTFLRTFDDGDFWAKETEVAAALKRLAVTPPKLVFATDGYQRSADKIGDRDYKAFFNSKGARQSLINQGFDIDSAALESQDIPKDAAVLIFGDPKVAYTAAAQHKIQQFIDRGGNILFLGEPGKQDILNPLIAPLGVQLLNGTLIQESRDYSYGLVTPLFSNDALQLSNKFAIAIKGKKGVSMPGAAALAQQDSGTFKTSPLLLTDARKSWIKQGSFVLDSAAVPFEPGRGDRRGVFPTAVKLTRTIQGREQRIVIAGDADFISNKELSRSNMETANGLFSTCLAAWFVYEQFPIDLQRIPDKDKKLRIDKTGVRMVQIVYYGIIPLAILLLGSILLIRRKQK